MKTNTFRVSILLPFLLVGCSGGGGYRTSAVVEKGGLNFWVEDIGAESHGKRWFFVIERPIDDNALWAPKRFTTKCTARLTSSDGLTQDYFISGEPILPESGQAKERSTMLSDVSSLAPGERMQIPLDAAKMADHFEGGSGTRLSVSFDALDDSFSGFDSKRDGVSEKAWKEIMYLVRMHLWIDTVETAGLEL